jgi:hypothetical protein
MNARALSTAANQGIHWIYENVMRLHHRFGRVGDHDVLQSFTKNLFHIWQILNLG